MEAALGVGGGKRVGTFSVSGEQTFTAAHVDDNFQSRLLSGQQCRGLSKLLVSRLKNENKNQASVLYQLP